MRGGGKKIDLRGISRRDDRSVAVGPRHGERVVGHLASPRESEPANVTGRHYLDDGGIVAVGSRVRGDGDAEGDVLARQRVGGLVLGEGEASLGVVVDGSAVRLTGRRCCNSLPSGLVLDKKAWTLTRTHRRPKRPPSFRDSMSTACFLLAIAGIRDFGRILAEPVCSCSRRPVPSLCLVVRRSVEARESKFHARKKQNRLQIPRGWNRQA